MWNFKPNFKRSPLKFFWWSPDLVCGVRYQSLANVSRVYSVSQKNPPPYGFLKFFPKRLGLFNQFFTHLLYDHFYTRVQIFIQISPTMTKLFLHFTRTLTSNFAY